ncbi:MAG: lipocalin family protein [Thermoplasmatota archaeon]
MAEWSALPWNTILIIIGLSFLVPSILSILFIKLKKYEELGIALGIFFILLASISLFYIIPNEVVEKAVLPEDYTWEDIGNVYYWERNSVFAPSQAYYQAPYQITNLISENQPIIKRFKGRQVIHAVSYDHQKGEMLIHEALYDENNEIFKVIDEREPISEWYVIDPRLSSLEFINVDAGRMGIPRKTNRSSEIIGWVESNGEKLGPEHVVLTRDMEKINSGLIHGIEAEIWESVIYNKPIIWHQQPYVCDETFRLTVNPKTGYIMHIYRHLVISAKMSQFIEIYSPELLQRRSVNRYLKINDPIGEAAVLIYESTDQSVNNHIAKIQELHSDMTLLPIYICVPIFLIGLLLLLRYGGRGNYWKRHKELDQEFITLRPSPITGRTRIFKILSTLLIVGIILVASISSVFTLVNYYQTTIDPSVDFPELSFPQEIPTPPGSNRGIDLGRHVLEPADEGLHPSSRREWWYFNVFFNEPGTELENHSMIISFNRMAFNDIRFLKRDNLFIILYDDQGGNQDFSSLDNVRGTLQADGPGVNVVFEESWAKGSYPEWDVQAVNTEKGFRANLNFVADFWPVWVLGRSSNLPRAGNYAGNYYIPRCLVTGTITLDGVEYKVSGTGYHDHLWETLTRRIITTGWDWYNIHFENGWEIYLSKFNYRLPLNRYAAALIISPDNRNMVEFDKFTVTYTQTASPEGMPLIKYPLKSRVEAQRDDMILTIDIENYNICDIVWRFARTGMFEGPVTVSGTFSWAGYSVDLQGYGMGEITRVKYIVERPRILIK